MQKGFRAGSPQDLSALIGNNEQANAYFMSLPGYVKDMISQRGGSIHTEEELRKYAEKLLEND